MGTFFLNSLTVNNFEKWYFFPNSVYWPRLQGAAALRVGQPPGDCSSSQYAKGASGLILIWREREASFMGKIQNETEIVFR